MCHSLLLLSAILTILVAHVLAFASSNDDFECIEKNYNYLSCQWNFTDDTSCCLLTNPSNFNSSFGICDIQKRGNKLFCNISQHFYSSLGENEFVLHNACKNSSDSHHFSTKTDENVQLNPVKRIQPSWTSQTEANLTWSLPAYPCMVNDAYNGGINCTVSLSVNIENMTTTLGAKSAKNSLLQKKWRAASRGESSCYELPSMFLTFQHLRPSTLYIADVQCRPFGSQYWSEPARCSFVTSISKPYNTPWSGPGSYVLHRCGDTLCLTIYWRYTRFSSEEISGYVVNISQSSPISDIMVNRTMATILNLPIVSLFTVTVRARNSAGTSPPLSLQINTRTIERQKPVEVIAEHVRGYTYEVTFSRAEQEPHTDMVIYYWCRGEKQLAIVHCQGSIEWKKVPFANLTKRGDTYKYNISTDSEDDVHFAVALQDNAGTSGMAWGTTVHQTAQGNINSNSSTVAETALAVTASVLLLISITIFKLWKRGSPSDHDQIELPVILSLNKKMENVGSSAYTVEVRANDQHTNNSYVEVD